MHRYAPYYCEENIWQLAQTRSQGSALFISNAHRQVACFAQKRAPDGAPVVWDYHVVWLDHSVTHTIWDFDSHLELGVPALRYLESTFLPVAAPFAPTFRCVSRDVFLATFASDRRHMQDADGGWKAPPPPWPTIGEGHTLETFVDMTREGPGTYLDLVGLTRYVQRLALRL